MDDRRQHARVDARPENRRHHRRRHRQGADRKHRLASGRNAAVVVARDLVLGHRVLHGFALPDEIEHHHRVGEQRDHRREDAERDVARDVGALQPEDGGDDQSGETDEHGGEERLSHESRDHSSSAPLARRSAEGAKASPFIGEWIARLAPRPGEPRRRSTSRWDVDAMRSRWRSRGSACSASTRDSTRAGDAMRRGERCRRYAYTAGAPI